MSELGSKQVSNQQYGISQAAKASQLSTKTVRYYDDIKLVSANKSAENGYRYYNDKTLQELVFVRRCRGFDFSIEDIRKMLLLFRDPERTSREVKQITSSHLTQMKAQMVEMQALCTQLEQLTTECQGDDNAHCPILDNLTQSG
jgi:Cu(I)-responsive transcriptional regulator